MSIEPVYLVLNGELTIDAPVPEVWHHVLNYPSWQNYSVVRHISGEPGAEGEVVLLKKEEKGFEFPAFYARTIKLEAPHRVIWKTYLEKKPADADFFGIVDFRLEDRAGQTHFSYNNLYEFLLTCADRAELEAFRSRQRESFEKALATIFPKLKTLSETRHGQSREASPGAAREGNHDSS